MKDSNAPQLKSSKELTALIHIRGKINDKAGKAAALPKFSDTLHAPL
jgi:hypothetical protein